MKNKKDIYWKSIEEFKKGEIIPENVSFFLTIIIFLIRISSNSFFSDLIILLNIIS